MTHNEPRIFEYIRSRIRSRLHQMSTSRCLLNKEDTGYSQSQRVTGLSQSPLTLPATLIGSEASSSNQRVTFDTGNWSSTSEENSPCELARQRSVHRRTANLQEVQQPATTSGRIQQESTGPSLNLGSSPSNATQQRTGILSGIWQNQVRYFESLQTYEYCITELSEQSQQTILCQLEWSELSMCSGVRLVLASHGVLGRKLDHSLTLKIHQASSGVDILVRKVLSSMNLEEELVSTTYSAGLTDTRSMWKSKVHPFPYVPPKSGSPATSPQRTGTQN